MGCQVQIWSVIVFDAGALLALFPIGLIANLSGREVERTESPPIGQLAKTSTLLEFSKSDLQTFRADSATGRSNTTAGLQLGPVSLLVAV